MKARRWVRFEITRLSACAGLGVVLLAGLNRIVAQQVPAPTPASPVPVLAASSYLAPALPGNVYVLLLGYGNRLQVPGNERETLTGTFTDGSGTAGATLIAQIPGEIRLTIGGAAARTLIFNGTQATSNGATAIGADLDLIESFQADTVENFFYSYGKTAGVRFLGGRFRTDGQTTAGYTGPYYDIYELTQRAAGSGNGAVQQKYYYFDSVTGQFSRARYKILSGGQTVEVQTVYSGWTKSNGQSWPGTIVRLENGAQVFSFVVSNAQFSQGATTDAVFAQP